MGRGGDDMGVTEGCRVLARRDEPGEMGHVDHECRANLVGDGTEARKVDVARIGRTAGDDQGRLMLLGQSLYLVEIDQMIVLPDAILNGVEPFAGHCRLGAVR